MIYLLIEIRESHVPVITELTDESFAQSSDPDTEIVLRSDGSKYEKYNVNKESWEDIPKI